jgi:hypothetical protein
MQSLADTLVEAVLFIAHREYTEDSPIEEYEDEDVEELETLKNLLASATDDEKKALTAAIERAMAALPKGSELTPLYRVWMRNMFGDDDTDAEPPQIEIEV